MSLIDPDAARRQASRRLPTPRDLVPWAIAAFLGGALLGFGIEAMAARGTPDFSESPIVRITLAMVLMPVGGILTIFSWIAWLSRVGRNPALPGWAIPTALSLLGAAIGTSVARDRGPLIGEPRLSLVAVLLLAGAVLIGALGVISWMRRRARLDVDAEIMRTGSRTLGTVTNQGYTHFTEGGRLITQVTYSYPDGSGNRRYVRRSAIIEASDPVVNGDAVDVWFDPADPGNERRVVVRRQPRG